MSLRAPTRVVLGALAAAAMLAACQGEGRPCSRDEACDETQVCEITIPAGPFAVGRCTAIPVVTAATCAGDADCADGRACVAGSCRFAAPCFHLGGFYRVYQDGVDGGDLGVVQLEQPVGSCNVVARNPRGGTPIPDVRGTVNREGTVAPVTGACSGSTAGSETYVGRCPMTGTDGGRVYHLYATEPPDGGADPDEFHPTRCGADAEVSNPCNGRRCDRTTGNCVPTSCPRDALGVPVCNG